jgi:hypothetical protein
MSMPPNSSIDFDAIVRSIGGLFGKFPHTQALLRTLEGRLGRALGPGEPEHLMVVGEPGTGKSTALRRFHDEHPRIEHEEWTEVPVLYCELPAKTSIKQLAGQMLDVMGSEFADKGDEVQRTRQLKTLIKACRTRVIVLDEVNHLVDRGGVRTHYRVSDWVKQLSWPGGPVLVLAGTPNAKLLLEANLQLRSRVGEEMSIDPLSANGAQSKVFAKVLRTFGALIKPLDCIDLGDPLVTRQMAFATGGRLRAIQLLLRGAVRDAANLEQPRLDGNVLATAFARVIFPGASAERNPFCAEFNGVPLTKPHEPFAQEAINVRER